jgi:putative FmdB family regulatory protein
MPTYSYRCTECGTAFDIQQSFTDDSLTECPTCSGLLRKVFSPVGISFSGSGFYRNDSRAAEKSTSGASDKKTVKKTEKSAEKAAEKATPSAAPAASAPAASTSSASTSSASTSS